MNERIDNAVYYCKYLLLRKHNQDRHYKPYARDLLRYYNFCVKRKVWGFEDLPKLTKKDLKEMGYEI